MKRVAWLTDLHFDFLSLPQIVFFWDDIATQNADAILISGDISHAQRLLIDLTILEQYHIPFYFVLGNHDFYGGSVAEVYQQMADFNQKSDYGVCLEKTGMIALTEQTVLLGHGAWGDARYGDVLHMLELNDDVYIQELAECSLTERIKTLNRLGEEAAQHIQAHLSSALDLYPNVMILTHVPPFQEAALYEGRISPPRGLPRFSCRAVGDMLMKVVNPFPERQVSVLCGHTHHAATFQALPNLKIRVGEATYKKPVLQAMLEIP